MDFCQSFSEDQGLGTSPPRDDVSLKPLCELQLVIRRIDFAIHADIQKLRENQRNMAKVKILLCR